jgi:hypothetical protein
MRHLDESLRLTQELGGGHLKEWREFPRGTLHPAPDLLDGEKSPCLDLSGSKAEGAITDANQILDKLESRFLGRPHLPELDQTTVCPDLLTHLPVPRFFVGLATVNMTGSAGAPFVRVVDLPRGTFLQKQFSTSVKDPKMDGTVGQVIHMNLCPEAGFQYPVL